MRLMCIVEPLVLLSQELEILRSGQPNLALEPQFKPAGLLAGFALRLLGFVGSSPRDVGGA